MCRIGTLVVAGLLLAAPLFAQDSEVVRLQHRTDSLLRSWHEAQRLADVADSLERVRATSGSDTIAVGGLRIIANTSPLPLRAAAERAWPVIDSLFGDVARELVRQPYIIRAIDPDTATRAPILHVGLELPWDLDLQATTNVLLATADPPRFDQGLITWMGGVLRPSREDGARAVYVQLVTAPSETVRRCYLGDIPSCEDVLQFGDSTTLLQHWYVTPEERETLVRDAFREYFARGATAPTLRHCVEHDPAACVALLQSLPAGTLPWPLTSAARTLLVREALRAGGRDAYSRLVGTPGTPIGIRLASAAGMPLDSLVTRWRERVLAARPAPLALPWWMTVAAVGWTALFGFCASRSSRWRL